MAGFRILLFCAAMAAGLAYARASQSPKSQGVSENQGVSVGVNAFFPTWAPPGTAPAAFRRTEQAWIDGLVANKVKIVRTDMNTGSAIIFRGAPGGAEPGYIHDAFAKGIRTILVVGPGNHGYKPAPGCPRPNIPYAAQCLSAADPQKWASSANTADSLPRQLDILESQGVKLAALEVLNEFNWGNGDLNLGRNRVGRFLTLRDLENPADAEGRKVASGYLVYLKLVQVVKDWRDHSALNRDTPIISGGLANWHEGSASPPDDVVPIVPTIQFLRQHGLDDLVDGYGVHAYPAARPPANVQARIAALKANTFAVCRAAKPCWLTEWGFHPQVQPCPVGDGREVDKEDTELVRVMREAFRAFAEQRVLANITYFDWEYAPPSGKGNGAGYSIHGSFPSCGAQPGITRSGRLAIAPLPLHR